MMAHLQINPQVTIAELAVKLGFSDHDACDRKKWEIFGLRMVSPMRAFSLHFLRIFASTWGHKGSEIVCSDQSMLVVCDN